MTWPGGGNVSPLVTMGQRLLERGHHVRALSFAGLFDRFEEAGIAFHATTDDALASDVVAAAREQRTDVVVVDFMQPDALSAAESLGVPVAAYVHTLYYQVAIGPWSPMFVGGSLDDVNALRSSLGLEPVAALPELLDRAALVLVTTAEALDAPAAPVRGHVRYVGPIVEDAGPDTAWRPPWPPDRPLVHVSMGTVPADDDVLPIVQTVLDAVAPLDVRAFVTLAGRRDRPWAGAADPDASALRVPANAALSGTIRHAALLRHAQLFVTHAGLSSVGAALALGVPMVCLPITHEQPVNARQVEAVGAGVALPRDADVDVVRSAVADVLADDQIRATCRRFARDARGRADGSTAATALEGLLSA